MGQFLRSLLLAWLQETQLSEAEFGRRAKLSRATVNKVKNRAEGGGPRTVEGFARALGKTSLELYSEKDRWSREQQGLPAEPPAPQPERAPRFGDLPDWGTFEAQVRSSRTGRRYSEGAWESARNTRGGKLPSSLDQITVLRLVEFWQDLFDAEGWKHAG